MMSWCKNGEVSSAEALEMPLYALSHQYVELDLD